MCSLQDLLIEEFAVCWRNYTFCVKIKLFSLTRRSFLVLKTVESAFSNQEIMYEMKIE